MLGYSIGNYQIVSEIGKGGMGVVYLAQHLTLGRPAAVKVLLPELSTKQDVVTRFFNEARAATAVRHPGIVEVFDFGFVDDGSAYIIMEFLDGESLGARMRRGPSTVTAALMIARGIARTLQAAHERGIVHRDLKPDNVFLVPDAELPSGHRVKLLDFGIAKLASDISETSHTRTGTVMGTPTYMAPEQCRGAGSVDHRADLYALGCVVYEMLCGRPPFVAEGAGDVIAHHLYFSPQPPRTHRPDLRVDVEDFVLWLLQKDPRERPNSAADVVQTIERLAAAAPVVALHSEPTATAVAADRPMDTTLSSAASMSDITRPAWSAFALRGTRLWLILGALAVMFVTFAIVRGARETIEPSEVVAVGEISKSSEIHNPTGGAKEDETKSSQDGPVQGANPTGGAKEGEAKSSQDRPVQDTKPTGGAKEGEAKSSQDRPVQDTKPTGGAKEGGQSSEDAKLHETVPIGDSGLTTSTQSGSKQIESVKQNKLKTSESNHSAEVKATDTRLRDGIIKRPEGCTRSAFAAVLDAGKPDEKAIQSALGRLKKCKSEMSAELHDGIQRELIGKF